MGAGHYQCEHCGAGNVAIRGNDDYENSYWVCGNCEISDNKNYGTEQMRKEILTQRDEINQLRAKLNEMEEKIITIEQNGGISLEKYNAMERMYTTAKRSCIQYKKNVEKFVSMLTYGVKDL